MQGVLRFKIVGITQNKGGVQSDSVFVLAFSFGFASKATSAKRQGARLLRELISKRSERCRRFKAGRGSILIG